MPELSESELEAWEVKVKLGRIRNSQIEIDAELNHLSRVIRILKDRKEMLIESRDVNLGRYMILKSEQAQKFN